MEPRISIVTLGVSSLEQSRKFYRDGIGWAEASANDDIAFYQLGAVVLGLYPRVKLAEDAQVNDDGPHQFSGMTLAHNCRSEAEVDAVLDHAVAAGAKLQKAAEKVFWGGYSGYFADPDGYLWEVAHNPFAIIDENGVLRIAPGTAESE